MPRTLSAWFFDWDNTLLDLDSTFRDTFRAVLAPLCEAWGVDPDHLRRVMDDVWPTVWARGLSGALTGSALYPEWFREALPRAGFPTTALDPDEVAEYFDHQFEDSLRLHPDALPALLTIRSQTPRPRLVILTNGLTKRQMRRIEAVGVLPYVDAVLTSEMVGAPKPGRAFFDTALGVAEVSREAALMIGDDPATDIAGANRAGIASVWVNRHGRSWPETLIHPSLTVTDLAHLLQTLEIS